MITSDDLTALVFAWSDWSRKPSGVEEAAAMERECRAVAARAGLPTSRFRDRLVEASQAGMERRPAIVAVLAEAGVPVSAPSARVAEPEVVDA